MPREGDTMGRTMGGLIDDARVRWGDREALAFKGSRFSFGELATEVDRLAKGLIQLGVTPGEKVAIWLQNCPEWIHAMFACAKRRRPRSREHASAH
jgi:fatty-acyl-CoA synthase